MINFKIKYHNVKIKKTLSKKIQNIINEKVSKLTSLNILNDKKDINLLQKINKKNFNDKKKIIILGTGGSSLGGRALVGILNGNEKKKIIFLDNIDPISFQNSIKNIKITKIGIIIISKSGQTPETLSQFTSIINKFKNNKNFNKFVTDALIITENKDNPLRKIAKKYKCRILNHHSDIGGRYSVFSNVGLLPAVMAGLDISQIRLGARNLITDTLNGSFKEHLRSAYLLKKLQDSKKINLNVLMTYSDSLYYFGKWYLQLWSESIGKNFKGITPIHSIGTTDQHSQLQLYLDGPKDKFFTLITKDHRNLGLKMNNQFLKNTNAKYLVGKKMGDLMHAEQQATLNTFISSKLPIREIFCNNINEYTIGQLLAFNILEVISICTLIKVNPFNQPAVEKGKKLTKQYLSKY